MFSRGCEGTPWGRDLRRECWRSSRLPKFRLSRGDGGCNTQGFNAIMEEPVSSSNRVELSSLTMSPLGEHRLSRFSHAHTFDDSVQLCPFGQQASPEVCFPHSAPTIENLFATFVSSVGGQYVVSLNQFIVLLFFVTKKCGSRSSEFPRQVRGHDHLHMRKKRCTKIMLSHGCKRRTSFVPCS